MGSHRVRLYVYVHTHVYVSNLRKLPNRTQAWDPELVGGGGGDNPRCSSEGKKNSKFSTHRGLHRKGWGESAWHPAKSLETLLFETLSG